ncbi:hypothetical protein CBP36_21210 (plasmid) [Acidovorax carolinensis]|uniref:Initiator Rep protein WH1 domain-containing protein n=1 Tax=Acidovorax carolinensis TaxID=553814 RepID=A0A240UJ37_9BURK|nr:replication initiation protein [Acidovorax carolinensis]ART61488.1 hypothetical protein CBP36_21210 [Acidovorax carolinensis]
MVPVSAGRLCVSPIGGGTRKIQLRQAAMREIEIVDSSHIIYDAGMSQTDLFPGDAIVASSTREDRMLKHVNAVAIMPIKGGGKISVFERRLYNVLLHRSQELGEQTEYSARMHEIAKDCKFESNNTLHIKKALTNLMKTIVEWQSPTTNELEEVWDACGLLSGAAVRKNKKTGAVVLEWRYDIKIKQQLLSPERYARLTLESITQLRTHAALALYEICARYVDNPAHKTARQHWRWWRPVLCGQAYDDEKGEYRYFKRDVLQPAIAEINANTELNVQLLPEFRERDNKTVSEIQFEVKLKTAAAILQAPQKKPLDKISEEDLALIGNALQAGLTQAEAESLYRKSGARTFARGLEDLQERVEQSGRLGPVESPAGYLRAILRTTPNIEADESQTKPSPKEPKELEKNKTALHEEWLRRKKDELRAMFQECAKAEQESLLNEFRASLSNQPMINRLDSNGWNHRMVRDTFASFLGKTWHGPNWNQPGPDDILALALEKAPASS